MEVDHAGTEILESGTSLAEDEFGEERAPMVNNSNITNFPTETGNATSHTDIFPNNDIEALRSQIADDVLVASDGNSLFCFSSPFEMPRGAVDLNLNSNFDENENENFKQDHDSNSNRNKYLQVPMVYCDQTASNKPLQSIERYMEKTCLPFYGNTHTNTSITGAQSTALVAEARQIVAEATNARITGKASLDVVLFTGNGTTSAVETLIDCLGLKYACADANKRPVVFIGPYEHHSNLIPWREAGCEIVPVPECPTSKMIDYQALERVLQNPQYDNRLKMGTFTAASNVTGKVSDVDRIADMLHRYGALAFFDYATGAPYMTMDMNPSPSDHYPTASLVAKDAIFLSPHKMIGGIGTPGVLVVKKHLVHQQNAPSRSGGGTVFYVTNTHHRFLSSRIDRYEGGTPNVSGIQRVGLAFLFKRQVEQKFRQLASSSSSSSSIDSFDRNVQSHSKNEIPPTLQHYEYSTYDRSVAYLREHAPNIHLLDVSDDPDNQQSPHLPIFSFLIKFGNRFLHFNYVCAILNDVFGIQSRGGCQCAGPYSQRLLGLTKVTKDGDEVPNTQNEAIEHALLNCKERAELLRPGYTRLSLPFKGLRTEEVEYVFNALVWTAKNGWALMCKYRCNHRTGEWRHANRQGKPLGTSERKWLSHYSMFSQQTTTCTTKSIVAGERRKALENALANADLILKEARADQRSIVQASKMHDTDVGPDSDMLEKLRWYMHPKECASFLTQGIDDLPPGTYSGVLEGALNPLCCFSGLKPEYTVVSPQRDTVVAQPVVEMATGTDRKRKQTNSVSCDEMESDNKNLLPKHKDNVTQFYFRDGEHSGEASFDEISAGFDDEELSEECQILDKQSGGWIPIETFLREGKQSKYLLSTDGEVANTPQPPIDSTLDTAEFDEKNSNKKPARGSTSWGQGNAVSGGGTFEASKADTAQQDSQARTSPEKKKFKKFSHVKPPAKIMRLMTQAIIQWNMLEEGDRLLLGLSGGKDSLSLLHCLLECRRKLPIHFEIEVCTIDPMTPSFDPSPLIPYVKSLGLTYHYIRDDIVARANSAGKDGKTVSSLCAYCARMKRGNLYTCARKNKCNKLVLAQHLDDCAESFLMSVMHNGFLRTMKANYTIDAGDLTVLRPLIFCRESLMTAFAKSASLPVINENCPACFEEPKERARVKKLLAREETLYPNFYDNIRRSLIPLMHDDMSSILRGYTEEVVRRSRKEPHNVSKKHRKNLSGNESVSADLGRPIETAENTRQVSLEQATVEIKILFDNPLANASDDELVMELARRKAHRFRQTSKRGEDDGDPTGLVCSLNGGNGTIPCRELME